MSGSKCGSQSVTIKTEPVDSFEEDSYNDVPLLNNKSNYLKHFSHKDPGEDAEYEAVKGDTECAFSNSNEIAEKLKHLKRSDSDDDDPGCDSDFTLTDFHEVQQLELSDGYDSPCSIETSNMEESEDRKPSQEELEMYSSGLRQSAHGKKHVSSVASTASDDFHMGRRHHASDFRDFKLRTPRVVLPRVSASQLSSFSFHRYARSSSKNKNNHRRNFVESEIMKPIFNNDGVITSYQCVECSKKFIKRQTLRQHFITHTDRFACPYCVARCKSKGDLARHIQTHTKEKPFHCKVCNSNYARKSILKKHMKTQRHLRSLFESRNLAQLKMIRDKQKYVDSSVTAQVEVKLRFSCSRCQKVTFSRLECRKHMKSHILKFICDICQKGCKSLPLLKVHKRSHSKSTSLVCKVCSRSFANFHCLKEHTKSHKLNSLNRVMKEVPLNSTISKHRRISPGVKVQSQQMSQLKSVEGDQRSAGVNEIKCDDCHKRFFSSRCLTSHKCTHADTYICGICTKTFSNICKLKIHLKLHNRIIKCDICDIIFYEETELEEHVQEEHAEDNAYIGGLVDEFTCALCYDIFDNASDLGSHMEDHAPTMLFSGKSLDEKKTVPVVKRPKITSSASVVGVEIKTEVASDSEDENVLKRSEKAEAAKSSDSDDDSILDSKDFYEILNRALGENDSRGNEGNDNDADDAKLSDTDEELCSDIKTVLENEVLSSDESGLNELEEFNVFRKPLLYSHEDIMKNYCAEFERYSEKDEESQTFKCTLCCKVFKEDKYLKTHLKHHVCEFCNVFFNDTEKLAEHKFQHEKQLVNQIRAETRRLLISKKWKDFSVALSASENELADQMINGGDIKDDSSQAESDVNSLNTLSHDVIIQANKHNFENFSCLDPNKNIFACKICNRDYARATTLTRHMKTHVCEFCSKFFEDKSDLFEHRYNHRKKAALKKAEITGEDATIRPCSIVSKLNRIKFKKYSFIDRSRNIYQCTLCQRDFVRRTVLTRHLKTHICGRCDKFYEDKYELAKHYLCHSVEQHNIEKDKGDDVADGDEFSEEVGSEEKKLSVSSVTNKEVHLKHSTLLPSIPQSGISLLGQAKSSCGAEKDKVTSLRVLKTEDDESANTKVISVVPDTNMMSFQTISQPVQMSIQAISQPVQIFLNTAHLAASASFQDKSKSIKASPQPVFERRDRPFECGECGKTFLKNNHLMSHLTIHTGDRPFKCSYCGKTFGRRTTLLKHLKIHRKPCRVCGSIFAFKYELDLHMAVHRTSTFLS